MDMSKIDLVALQKDHEKKYRWWLVVDGESPEDSFVRGYLYQPHAEAGRDEWNKRAQALGLPQRYRVHENPEGLEDFSGVCAAPTPHMPVHHIFGPVHEATTFRGLDPQVEQELKRRY